LLRKLDKRFYIMYTRNGRVDEVTISTLSLYQLLQFDNNVLKFSLDKVLIDGFHSRTWCEYFDSLNKEQLLKLLSYFFAISFTFPIPHYETKYRNETRIHGNYKRNRIPSHT
jgi:hypothetical protein